MADANLQINVRTTADLSGLKQLRTEVQGINSDIAAQLAAAGAQFDPITRSFKSIKEDADDAAKSTGGIGDSALFAGAQLGKARGEATVLAREIATGSVQARTLGALLGALGTPITVAAIAGIGLYEILTKAGGATKKLNDEIAKENESLVKSSEHWERIAQGVNTQSQLTSLVDSMGSKLEEVNTKLSDLLRKDLETSDLHRGLTTIWAAIGLIGTQEEATADAFDTGTDKEVRALEAFREKLLAVQVAQLQTAQEHQAATIALAKTKDQVAFLVAAIISLIDEQSKLDTSTVAGMEAFIRDQNTLKNLEDQINLTSKAMKELDDQVKKLNQDVDKQVKAGEELLQKQLDFRTKIGVQAAINLATGDEELTVQTKVNKVYSDTLAEANKIGIYGQEAINLANTAAEAERQRLEAMRGMAAPVNTLNDLFQRQQTLLQNIREQATLIKDAPFLSPDAKAAASLASYQKELDAVKQAMLDLQRIRGGLTDPVEIDKADKAMQNLVFHSKQLHMELDAATHPLQASLQKWADSFGSTMTQIGRTIEQTVGVALRSVNDWIITGKFNAQQFLQDLERLGLQLVENILIQQAVALINNAIAAAEAKALGSTIATSMAGAATAATIATEGAAAAQAPASVALALGSVTAILGGTAHTGGPIRRKRMHSGGLAADEVPIIAQEGEIMIQRDVAQQSGMADFLLALNAGAFHRGGSIRRMHEGGDLWTPGMLGDSFWGDVPPWSEPTPIPSGPPSGGGGLPPDLNPHSVLSDAWANRPDIFQEYPWLNAPGYFPPAGTPGFSQGPTIIPTYFDPQGYPYAVPAQPLAYYDSGTNPWLIQNVGTYIKPHHTGGQIGRSHSGGPISVRGLPRFHSGGQMSGGSMGAMRGGGVHIYTFTDLKELSRHMASREGQKIIVDTIRGQRIDLGI